MILSGKLIVKDVKMSQYMGSGITTVKRVFLIPDEESRELLFEKNLENSMIISMDEPNTVRMVPLYFTTRNYSRAYSSPIYSIKYIMDNFDGFDVKLSVEVRANVVRDMVRVTLEYDPKSIEITGEKLYLVYSWRGDIRSKTGRLGRNGSFIPDDTSNGYPYHTNVPQQLMVIEGGRILCYEKDLPEAMDMMLKHKEEYLREIEAKRNKVEEDLANIKESDPNDISFLINTIDAWEGKYRGLGKTKEAESCHLAKMAINKMMEE